MAAEYVGGLGDGQCHCCVVRCVAVEKVRIEDCGRQVEKDGGRDR